MPTHIFPTDSVISQALSQTSACLTTWITTVACSLPWSHTQLPSEVYTALWPLQLLSSHSHSVSETTSTAAFPPVTKIISGNAFTPLTNVFQRALVWRVTSRSFVGF